MRISVTKNDAIYDLFTWRWGTPGGCGNPPVHIISQMVTNLLYKHDQIKMTDYIDRRVT